MNHSRKVLLIGWDAADWKVIHPLMDAGKNANAAADDQQWRDGKHGDFVSPSFANVMDDDFYRQAPIQARNIRLYRTDPR